MRSKMILWLVVLALVALALGALQVAIERETLGEPVVRNPDGTTGHALILYHPGLSDLQEAATAAFADGLVERGWRVTRTTTSREAPSDLREYDLLVLGVHTYWFAPDGPTRRYLARVDDLDGTPVVALLTALGAAGRAAARIAAIVEEAGGRVAAVQPLFVMRPNDETDARPNRVVALEVARRLGAGMASPP